MLCESICAKNEWGDQRLSERHLAAASKERRSILEQRVHLLRYNVDKGLRELLFLFTISLEDLEPEAAGFGEPSVDEEVDAGAGQGVLGVAGGGKDVRWVCICKECRNDARLCDNLAIEVNGWYKAALSCCQLM